MTAGSYLVGLATLAASVLFVLQPNVPESSGDGSWWEGLSQWMLHSRPAPPYVGLPLFGVIPDVVLRPSHAFLRGAGFHRKYRLKIQVQTMGKSNVNGCQVSAEWHFPRDIIIDQWLLHRAAPIAWEVGSTIVNLEVPAYSEAAQPFTLRASLPVKTDGSPNFIDIPDIVPRYQKPSLLLYGHSPKFFIHPPKISLECPPNRTLLLLSSSIV